MSLEDALKQLENWSITLANHAKSARKDVFETMLTGKRVDPDSRAGVAREELQDVRGSIGEVTCALKLVNEAIDELERNPRV